MASKWCVWVSKYLLCIINFLSFVVGTVAIGVGLWLVIDKASLIALFKPVDPEYTKQFSEPQIIDYLAYVILIIGIVMFLFGILGYCSVLHESRGLVITYAALLCLLLIVEIVGLGMLLFCKNQLDSEAKTYLTATINDHYSHKDHEGVTLMWDKIMSQHSCCGVVSHNDFRSSSTWQGNRGNQTIPAACCILKDVEKIVPRDDECPITPNEQNSYMNNGCYSYVMEKFTQHQLIVILVLVLLIALQILEISLAITLSREFAKYDDMRL